MSPEHAAIGPRTSGLDHVALRCTDLARSRRFYTELLGFPVVAETATVFVVRAGRSLVGCVAPDPAQPATEPFDARRTGLDHVALACGDEAELQRIAAALARAGVETSGVKVNPLRANRYVAFRDPDGIAWQFAMCNDKSRR